MFATMMSKFLLNKNTIGIIIIIGLVTYVAYKINSLENQLEIANTEIAKLTKDVMMKDILVVNRDNTIANMTIERDDLIKVIDRVNAKSVKDGKLLEVAKTELLEWSNKPPEVKYEYITKYITKKVNYDKATCSQGLELMNTISNINYDEL